MEPTAKAVKSRGKKAKDPRKHHYVPVFYQNNFVNENGLLWVYDRARQTYKELHPRVICFERDLYAVKPEGKPPDMQVEMKVLSMVDAAGFQGIRAFLAGKPTRAAEEETAIFMAFSRWRKASPHPCPCIEWIVPKVPQLPIDKESRVNKDMRRVCILSSS